MIISLSFCIYSLLIFGFFFFLLFFFFFKQKTAYEMSLRDWSSDVYSSDLVLRGARRRRGGPRRRPRVHERHERGDHVGGLHVLGQRFANRVRGPRAGVPQGVLS